MKVAERFLDALAHRDWAGIAACFAPDAHFRALVPAAFREHGDPEAIGERFRVWFGDLDDYRLAAGDIEPFADVQRVAYRLEGREDGADVVVEQTAYVTVEHDRITALNLVCSGFRPR